MLTRFLLTVSSTLAVLVAAAGVAQATPTSPRPWVTSASTVLRGWYDPSTGLYRTTNWWNAANALQSELVASKLLGDNNGRQHAASTYQAQSAGGFRNDYYDDEGWWALTWVDAYDVTHDARYLTVAKALFTDMAASWDNVCGGGIWWSRSRTYKNAIPNELFIALSGKLALRTSGTDTAKFRDWALRSWNWFNSSGMINSASLINDGLDASCHNNRQTAWTYNQGVVLGGLSDLYRLTGQRSYLGTANNIATAAMHTLSDTTGVLHEPCEPKCGADGPQFKGVFMRNLAALNEVSPSPQAVTFVVHNANAIWQKDRSPTNQLGLVWSGPFDSADASRQSSALDCLNAAVRMQGG